MGAVSYTHLDVYKRQVIHRSETKLEEKIDQLMEEALASTEVIEIL